VVYRKIEKPNQTIKHRTNKKGNAQTMVKLNKTDEQVMNALKEGKELTLQEIADKTGEKPKKFSGPSANSSKTNSSKLTHENTNSQAPSKKRASSGP
jgi:hypothetical protein